jgi:hypothetical protein
MIGELLNIVQNNSLILQLSQKPLGVFHLQPESRNGAIKILNIGQALAQKTFPRTWDP